MRKVDKAVILFGCVLIVAVFALNSCAICVDQNTGSASFYGRGSIGYELANDNPYCIIYK